MADPTLNALGVKAADVAQVEQTVLADAQASAAAAEQDEHAAALSALDAQILTARREELAAKREADARPAAPPPRKLKAIRARLAAALARRAKLVEAREERDRLAEAERGGETGATGAAVADDVKAEGESQRDFLIRTGRLTPFQARGGYERRQSAAEGPVRRRLGASAATAGVALPDDGVVQPISDGEVSEGHDDGERSDGEVGTVPPSEKGKNVVQSTASNVGSPPTEQVEGEVSDAEEAPACPESKPRKRSTRKRPRVDSDADEGDSSDYVPSEADDDFTVDADDEECFEPDRTAKKRGARAASRAAASADDLDGPSAEQDDEPFLEGDDVVINEADEVEFEGGLRAPASVYDRLFDYQKTAVQWLWELHSQATGGILGDEMGLGKTVQIVAFLASLNYSDKLNGSVIILAPTTVLRQWEREFRKWWPRFRVRILHHSQAQSQPDPGAKKRRRRNAPTPKYRPELTINEVLSEKHGVLITSYEQVRKNSDLFVNKFQYVIADEGHKMKSPDAEVTLACKKFNTPHRIIVSGSPLQNHLKELWSLFDFVFPGKLGTLPVFHTQFVLPITMGGYSTASKTEVHTAYKCSLMLRDLISPYLLRRMKKDVAKQLPEKSEQILFVKLSSEQREKYKTFLASRVCQKVLAGDINLLYAITSLRKVCNHPDIPLHRNDTDKELYGSNFIDKVSHLNMMLKKDLREEERDDYGNWKRSGKMLVLDRVLDSWRKDKSRVLLFSQTTTMLDILETFVQDRKMEYLRMDGTTAVGSRMALIDRFNRDENIFIFLLTTRVGGLGVNLTGANRVILYDPDWNPSTDLQARERAWRIGQKRAVTIYRFVTSGTIEEKIYHRQIYKQFLTSKVLTDSRQRRFFKRKEMKDLFTLGDDEEAGTETGDLFSGTNAKEMKAGAKTEPLVSSELGDDKEENAESTSGKGTASVLNSLLDDSNEGDGALHSTMNHDDIMSAGTVEKDVAVMEFEADKIAEEALSELRRSGRRRQRQSISVPTWTGKSGLAGILGSSSSNGPSRAGSLLQKMRERAGQAAGPQSEQDGEPKKEDLMGDIIDFFKGRGGECSSTELIESFNSRVTRDGNKTTFKSMLKRVARLEKGEDRKAVWKLRTNVADI